ncbi:predicted protein [Uncinocarpus reesii 1704]|uniref:Uncharacterized protein n=1 Tax=Uncinocarpus reesii (strain UAMH 1704) TaxID=336963 RepID=C4JWY4_UNCRE|nr:uncharacterized protein UREG_06157 [Uncinocarpus reesii 1704]EEP81292.1 predicted protein [Uncinocarpus reesii 1704]
MASLRLGAPVGLASMPAELVLSVAENLTRECDINSLARTNRYFNDILTSRLYAHNVHHNQSTALFWGIKHLEKGTIEKALDAGADINAPVKSLGRNSNTTHPILLAVDRPPYFRDLDERLPQDLRQKHLSMIQLLIDSGVDLEYKEQYLGRTALLIAASWGDDEIIRLLIDSGANINAVCDSGNTLLYYAAGACSAKTIHFLVDMGLDINMPGGSRTPLHIAANKLNEEATRALVERGAVVEPLNYDTTPFMLAANREGSTPILKFLLNHGANINWTDSLGCTPFHRATLAKDSSAILFLIDNGAKVDAKQHDGTTPLHNMLSQRDFKEKLQLTKLLLKHGADVQAEKSTGSTPLHTAAAVDDLKCLELLIEHGANVNKQDKSGYTALHIVANAAGLRKDLAALLLENGADLRLKTSYRRLALTPASWRTSSDNNWIEEAWAKYGNKDAEAAKGTKDQAVTGCSDS